MKMKTGTSRKLRYGGVTAALTAGIIAIVILVNVIFSAIAQKKLWYSDLTPELVFTLSENCITLMKDGDTSFENSSSPIEMVDTFRAEAVTQAVEALKAERPDVSEDELAEFTEAETKKAKDSMKINIIFCDDELTWKEDSAQRYVLETAKQLQDEFSDYIDIRYVDIIRNPTAVTKYGSGVTTSSVIIECGSEYRVRALKSFYVFNDDTEETPWAYNGEKILAAAILAVTRTFTPIACITTGNGEQLPGESFLLTLANAGFEVMAIDLETDEIPANCRLVIISSPSTDFAVSDGMFVSDSDEIDKLDRFLDPDDGQSGSLMVFMNPKQTTRLNNLEDYLEEWGIKFDRKDLGDGNYDPYLIQDNSQALDPNGYNIIGNYASFGLGAEITSELSEMGRKIIFPSAMSISYSDEVGDPAAYFADEERTDYKGDYGAFDVNGAYREMYDVFLSSDNAVAWTGQDASPAETAKNGNLFKLMTVTVEDHYTQESNYTTSNNPSYVFATGCNAFAADELLHGQYGNNMFLEYTLRIIAQEPVPVGLTFKPFGDYTIDTVTTAESTQYTVVLTLVPLVLSAGVGIFVIVRRKNR